MCLKWCKKNEPKVFEKLMQEVKTCRRAMGEKFMEMRKGFGNRRGQQGGQALIKKFKEKYPKEFEALQQLIKEERQDSRKEGKGKKKGKGKHEAEGTKPAPAVSPDAEAEDT